MQTHRLHAAGVVIYTAPSDAIVTLLSNSIAGRMQIPNKLDDAALPLNAPKMPQMPSTGSE
jgi:hypothetical protein